MFGHSDLWQKEHTLEIYMKYIQKSACPTFQDKIDFQQKVQSFDRHME